MNVWIASDIHGSALYCRKLLDLVERQGGDRLVLVSDGIPEADAQRCCARGQSLTPPELATQLISRGEQSGPDDATVVIVRLENR